MDDNNRPDTGGGASASPAPDDEVIRYEIDAHDRLVSVRDAWAAFASANGAPHLASGVLGRSLWDFVSDDSTRDVYRRLIAQARTGRVVTFRYRCDAPAMRRYLKMTIRLRAGDMVEFESLTLKTEPRAAPFLPAAAQPSSGALLRICSWCSRIAVEHDWLEAEDAIDRLRLFDTPVAATITHGMCAECIKRMIGEELLSSAESR